LLLGALIKSRVPLLPSKIGSFRRSPRPKVGSSHVNTSQYSSIVDVDIDKSREENTSQESEHASQLSIIEVPEAGLLDVGIEKMQTLLVPIDQLLNLWKILENPRELIDRFFFLSLRTTVPPLI